MKPQGSSSCMSTKLNSTTEQHLPFSSFFSFFHSELFLRRATWKSRKQIWLSSHSDFCMPGWSTLERRDRKEGSFPHTKIASSQAGDAAHLVECLPSLHRAWSSSSASSKQVNKTCQCLQSQHLGSGMWGLNENGPHRHMSLNPCFSVSVSIWIRIRSRIKRKHQQARSLSS